MSQVKAFLKKVNNDKSFQSKLESVVVANLDAVLESDSEAINQVVSFANDNGFEFSADEYKSVMAKLQDELSDGQLDDVAGGGGPSDGPEPEFL